MMNNNFDPYDALIELNERLLRLERAHNRLANEYQRSQTEFNQMLVSHKKLQEHVLKLHRIIENYTTKKTDN